MGINHLKCSKIYMKNKGLYLNFMRLLKWSKRLVLTDDTIFFKNSLIAVTNNCINNHTITL